MKPIYKADKYIVTKDGHSMFTQDIVKDLNALQQEVAKLERWNSARNEPLCHVAQNQNRAFTQNKEQIMNKVFLGGTCNETTWRDELSKMLKVDFFNPIVSDWTSECQAMEEDEKAVSCNVHLYVITSAMIGTFSIAEAVESSMTAGKQTIFHVIPDGFNKGQLKSLDAVSKMIRKHGGVAYIDEDLMRTARIINKKTTLSTL